MSSQLHRKALMKDLNETYVLVSSRRDNVEAMINQVIRGHRISFCDDESHNKALRITLVCREKVVNCIFDDDRSGVNICRLSTLR